MADFELHPRLAADTLELGDGMLSAVRIMNDRRFPWLILVPRRAGLEALHRMERTDHLLLMQEITLLSRMLEDLFRPHRINVGALGNLVPQLHLHLVARREGDAAWPGPVWGNGVADPYSAGDPVLDSIRTAFAAL